MSGATPQPALPASAPAPSGCDAGDAGQCGTILRFFIIHNMTMRIGDRLTAPIGLTSSRWMLLGALAGREAPPTLSELSADAMLSVQNVSRMVASMEAEGLLRRVSRKGSGRSVFVELTEAGQRAFDATRPLGERFHASFLAGLDPGEIAMLEQKLTMMIGNLERLERELGAQAPGRVAQDEEDR